MTWRTAKSLIKLRDQINAAYPSRSKKSDGTIGDEAHQKQGSASDHNPWFQNNGVGIVTALDITHDPASGCDVQKIADAIVASRDNRIKYLIFNDRILVPGLYGWKWVFHFEGSHRSHLHVSVKNDGDYDNQREWKLGKEDIMDARMTDNVWLGLFGEHIPKDKQNYWVGKKMDDMITRERSSAGWKARDRAAKGLMDDSGQIDAVVLTATGSHATTTQIKAYKGKNWHKVLDELRDKGNTVWKQNMQIVKNLYPAALQASPGSVSEKLEKIKKILEE